MRPMLHYPRRFAQRGFTLVEMAIVLVIIGILLGAVLKGQELIENSRVKDAANLINGVTAAYNGYIDRYGRLPGDDGPLAALAGRGGVWAMTGMSAGDNNGVIANAAANTFNTTGAEHVSFWRHLRAAGLIKGDPLAPAAQLLPRNAWGGLVGMNYSAVQGRGGDKLMICMRDVPGKAARALDRQMDDHIPNTGALRANAGASVLPTNPAATAYDETLVYTICIEI